MITLQLLEPNDIVYPDDHIRPLSRVADFCRMSDAWEETSPFGGHPSDHLRWSWNWLSLGVCWWGRPYQELSDSLKSFPYPREFVRGHLPESHKLSWSRWQHRHPLFWEFFQTTAKRVMATQTLGFGKYADRTLAQVLKHDPGYLDWMLRQGLDGYQSVAMYRWLNKYRTAQEWSPAADKYRRMSTQPPPTFTFDYTQ